MEDDFHSIISEIKPLAKRLPRNSERRHHVASWIKKLVSSSDCEIFPRTHYAKQLLHALQTGVFQVPFNTDPPATLATQVDNHHQSHRSDPKDLLPSTPTRNDDHYHGNNHHSKHRHSNHHHGNPSQYPASNSPPCKERGLFHSTPIDSSRSHGMTTRVPPLGFTSNRRQGVQVKQNSKRILNFSSSDSLDEICDATILPLNDSMNYADKVDESSTIIYSTSSSYSSDDLTDVSSLQPRVKQQLSLSDIPTTPRTNRKPRPTVYRKSSSTSPSHYTRRGKYLLHEHSIENRLKERETEEMKKQHSLQLKELEKRCSNLEDTVNEFESNEKCKFKENASRKIKNKQLQLLQTSYEKKLQSLIHEYDDRLNNMRQKHIIDMRQATDRAKMAIEHLKTEHSKQQQEMCNSMSELEDRLRKSVKSVDEARRTSRKLMKEKNSLSDTISNLEIKIKSSEKNIQCLEEKIALLTEEKEVLQSKGDVSVQAVRKQMADQRGVFLRKIGTLQQQVGKLQTELEEQANKQSMKLKNEESLHKLSSKETEVEYQKKILELKEKLQESEGRCRELEKMYQSVTKTSEQQMNEVKTAYQTQCTSIEEYRGKVEQQMKGMLGNLTNEVKRLESELGEEHRLRKTKEEELYCELSSQRARMTAEHSTLIKSMKEHFTSELETRDQTIHDMTLQSKEQNTRHKSEMEQKHQTIKEAKQTISNLNGQVQELLRTHQEKLDGIRKAYDNDKQLMEDNHEKIVYEMKSELEKRHKLEIASLTEKHKIQLRQLEHDQNMKVAIANETITSLQSQNRMTKDDLDRLLESHRKELENQLAQFELDIRNIEQKHEAEKKVMVEAIDNYRNTSEQLEGRITNLQQTYEYELSRLRNDYECRVSTGYNISPQYNKDEAIQSLQIQLQVMNDRANHLQKQVDQSLTCTKIRKHLATPTDTPSTYC